jgi:hypothetical protein
MSSLSPQSLETLIDLVEIKLSCLDVVDRADRREERILRRSLAELEAVRSQFRRRRAVLSGPAVSGMPADGALLATH